MDLRGMNGLACTLLGLLLWDGKQMGFSADAFWATNAGF